MTADRWHYGGMTIPKWLRVDLTFTEAAIIGAVAVACVSALVEFVKFMGTRQ